MTTKIGRRHFLTTTAGASATLSVGCGSCDESAPPAQSAREVETPPSFPVVAATWSWGRSVCERANAVLDEGGSLLDAVERGVNEVELDPDVLTVGYGGLPNEEGVVQLDAMIMDGARLEAGAVGALEDVPTAISVARRVMERTRHIYLVGEGARSFAVAEEFETRSLLTDESRRRHEAYRARGERRFGRDGDHDTVGVVAVNEAGQVVVGVSTSGLGFKLAGRVGDSPLVGAGGYADSDVGAACATGVGEEVIRVAGSYAVVEAMRAGMSPDDAAESVLERLRRKRGDALGDAQVAFIALRKDGEVGSAALRPGFEMHVSQGGQLS